MTSKIQVITLPYMRGEQRVDDSALIELQERDDVLAQTSYLMGPSEAQSLVLVLTTRPIKAQSAVTQRHFVTRVRQNSGEQEKPLSKRRAREAKLEAALAALSPEESEAFNALRVWRNEEAIRCGIPPFEVCSNQNLFECVSRRPTTLTALRAINGLGDRRVKRFGELILQQLELLGLIALEQVSAEAEDQLSLEPNRTRESEDGDGRA